MEPSKEVAEGLKSIGAAYGWLKKSLVDREIEIRLALVCLVSRQHFFLLGAPGTGKSYLARLVGRTLGPEAPFFELLLTRFTDPSEVYGPISVKQLVENERYVRKTEGYLPEAHSAFLDEIWKASSAILNSLLTIVNERVYDNGGRRGEVPLKTLFTASNELPQDDSLSALYDRFLVRREVKPVKDPLTLLDREPDENPPTLVHLDAVQAACKKIVLPVDVKQGMLAIKTTLQTQERISVGDRRFQLSASLIRAMALLDGRTEASPQDLQVLTHAWWQTPDQYLTVSRVVSEQIHQLVVARQPPPPPLPQPTQPPTNNGQNPQRQRRPAQFPMGHGPMPVPPAVGVPSQTQGAIQWTRVLAQIHGMPAEQMRRNATVQQLIHDCIVSPEARDPANKGEVLKLTKIKQDLMNKMQWVGPTW